MENPLWHVSNSCFTMERIFVSLVVNEITQWSYSLPNMSSGSPTGQRHASFNLRATTPYSLHILDALVLKPDKDNVQVSDSGSRSVVNCFVKRVRPCLGFVVAITNERAG